jgi:AbrB family looped-hinge helix DNA binding protein
MKDGIRKRLPQFYGAAVLGERGQIVIPAEARRNMQISPGDKLIVLSGPQGRRALMIIKAESILELLGKATEHISRLESMIKINDKSPK